MPAGCTGQRQAARTPRRTGVPLPAPRSEPDDFVKSAGCSSRLVEKAGTFSTSALLLRIVMRNTTGHSNSRWALGKLLLAAFTLWPSAGCCLWSLPSYRMGEVAGPCGHASLGHASGACGQCCSSDVSGMTVPTLHGAWPVRGHPFRKVEDLPPAKFHPVPTRPVFAPSATPSEQWLMPLPRDENS